MKTLRELLHGISGSWNGKGELATRIHRVQSDSRKVQPGDLFVAVSGLHVDGHQFIQGAVQAGARAIVSERLDRALSDSDIPQFCVANSREILSSLVSASYDFPERKLISIGITGTNGKTTTAFLIQYLLNVVSRSGLIGSICYDDGQSKQSAINTSPPPEVLYEALARMVSNGMSYCVMEVSSHALDQNRMRGLMFSSAVFTNLTQDHLDYHQSYEHYYQAKRKLFFGDSFPKHFIINGDDAYGARLGKELKGKEGVVFYGLKSEASYRVENARLDLDGLDFELFDKKEHYNVFAPLILQHNIYNLLAALTTISEEGFSLRDLIPHLSHFPGVCGRMERIDEGQDFHVFVDYAHTPDGLLNVLSSLKGLARGRIISVFGCGGDRDRSKRPVMGDIASRFSDVVILTSDNPRSERPQSILDEIKKGIDQRRKKMDLRVIPDRSEAIREAVRIAVRDDLVLLFGKGHEDYQVVGKNKIPFLDQKVARHWLRDKCLRSAKSQKLVVEN